MVLFIATEGATFAAAIASYFYLRFADAQAWPPSSDKLPDLVVPTIATAILVASVVPMWLAVRTARRMAGGPTGLLVLVTFLAGAAFVVLQVVDWVSEWPSSTLSKDAYGSLFFSVTGLHTAHVVVGLGMLLFLLAGAAVGRVRRGHWEPVAIVSLYWYFMAVLAVAVYLTVYITPYA
jgi:heme/copper-type cytochrome/quinol oxidase subunit 3